MKNITVIDFCSPQIKNLKKDFESGKISTVHMTFDSTNTALAFPKWLNLCMSGHSVSMRDGVKSKDLIMVWHGEGLNTLEFMSRHDAKEFIDDKIVEIRIVSPS